MVGEGVVERMFCEGVRRWPHVPVDRTIFHQHCERVLRGVTEGDAELHAAEIYLCCACCSANRDALAIVEREGAAGVRFAIRRVCSEPEFVQETLQEFWGQVLVGPVQKIRRYSGRGSLAAWLRVVATRMALDRCREQQGAKEREEVSTEQLVAESSDPVVRIVRTRYASAFQSALEHAILQLSETNRTLLRLRLEGCSVDDIGKIFGIHRATAARWVDRATLRVVRVARSRLAQSALAITESEFLSIARDVCGDLELRLSRESENHGSPGPGCLD